MPSEEHASPTPQRPPSPEPAAHEETARRAFELWRQLGRPAGREAEIWREAERQLEELNASSAGTE